MSYLVAKPGAYKTIYARLDQSGTVFFGASKKRATRFNLTQARRLARQESGYIVREEDV